MLIGLATKIDMLLRLCESRG